MLRPAPNLALVPLLVGAVIGIYFFAYSAGFVWLDHLEIVQGALIVERFDQIPGLFLQDGNFGGYHRPFYNLLHSLDHAIWGLDPFGFHLSSVLLHTLNALLVFAIALRLRIPQWPALMLAFVWAAHPTNASVAGLIHAKADLFVTTAILTMVLALQRALDAKRLGFGLAGVSFAVALFTKELAFVVPLGLTYWAWHEPRLRKFTGFTWILAIGVWVLRATVAAKTQHELPIGRLETFATFLTVYVDYVRRCFFPFDPAVGDTVVPWSALTTASQLRYGVALVVLVLLQVNVWRKEPVLRKWILAFHLALLPVSQFLVPTLHFRADRFLYLPTLCVLGLCVEGYLPLVRGRLKLSEKVVAGLGEFLGCFLVLFSGTVVFDDLADLQDDRRLFQRELDREPEYLEGLSALAAHYDREGDFERADEYYERCLRAKARSVKLSYLETRSFLVNRSFNLLAQNRAADARAFIEMTSPLVSDELGREQLDYNLAVAQFRLGEYAEALPRLREYSSAHPTDASCHYLLGVSAMETGEPELARRSFETYVQLAPNAPDREKVEAFLNALP